MGTAIVVTSGKGGTGKTSITGGVAGSLARLGHSVLCIDMDIGLRNLDISLGLSDRALMDFSDVAEGRCPLVRAAVNHPDLPGLALLTAPMTLSPALTEEAVRRMLDTARSLYDYVLIDSPAGLGAGFRMACCGADRAIVVSTNDASSLRDAQRTVGELDFLRQIHLVMNRIQPKLLRQLREIPGVKKVFVRSGLRYDYMMADDNDEFFLELVKYHISGQLKVAPEHMSDHALYYMGKPSFDVYRRFKERYERINAKLGKKQYLVPYLMSSHPGAELSDAVHLAECTRLAICRSRCRIFIRHRARCPQRCTIPASIRAR